MPDGENSQHESPGDSPGPAAEGTPAGGRLQHVDALRAIAILAMVWAHAAVALRPSSEPPAIGLALSAILGGLAAPLFVMLSGWGLHRSARRRIAMSARPMTDIGGWLLPRIALLVACQVVVNATMPHLFSLTTPGVLTLLALAAILAPCVAGLSPRSRCALATLLALSPLLLGPATGLGWSWSDRMAATDPAGTVGRLLWNGAYPALPWLSFALIGSLVADTDAATRSRILAILAPFSILLTVLLRPEGGAWVETIGLASLTFFPASVPFVAVASAACIAIHLLLERCENTPFWESSIGRATTSLGRLSLTVYVVHFIPLALLHRAYGIPVASIAGMTVFVVCYTLIWMPIAHLHSRTAPTLSLETLLSRLTPVTPRS